MGDPKTTIWQEFWIGVAKFGTWIVYISIAVFAKLAADSRVAKLTKRDIVIKTVLSVFAGVIAAIICESLKTKWWKVIVPVATLLGEGIVVYIMTNWRRLLSKIIPGWLDDEKKNDNLNK